MVTFNAGLPLYMRLPLPLIVPDSNVETFTCPRPEPLMEQWQIHELKDQLELKFLKLIGKNETTSHLLVPAEHQ